jgi:glyoxylase-like metal-dependent hydrolase (beta-lactamase superfamily II)
MRVHRIIVPTPFDVGPVNVYLIDEEPLTLIDAGPRTDEAIESLKSAFARLGRRFSDLRRIIITHAHSDHYGVARLLQEESGAQVWVHEWDAATVSARGGYDEYIRLLDEAGVPPLVMGSMEEGYDDIRASAEPVDRLEFVADGDDVLFEHESLTVLHTAGHTPGSICLVRSSNRTVFSADTVLKNITPNPVLSPDPIDRTRRFQSLGEYLVSIARLRSLGPTLLKGGHGDDVMDFEEHFNRLYQFHRVRQSKLLALLRREGVTAWEASLRLFPDAKRYHRFLALSETIAHLDYAVSENKLMVERRGTQDVYYSP